MNAHEYKRLLFQALDALDEIAESPWNEPPSTESHMAQRKRNEIWGELSTEDKIELIGLHRNFTLTPGEENG